MRSPSPTLADSVRLTDDGVDILDRRVFPLEHRWVHCATVEDVARAIEDMVTQSSGPVFAATAGMVLAARAAASQTARATLRAAGARLIATRPTNNAIRDAIAAVLQAAGDAADPAAAAIEQAGRQDAAYRALSTALGEHAAALLPDGARVLTHCWADFYLMATVTAAQRSGKSLEFVCTETRPYLQGARLTAATLVEFGYTPTVITDGMVPAALAAGLADVALTAADRVTMDGHVINKVGTLSVALAAREFNRPFHVLVHAPDPQAGTASDVVIEQRNGDETLHVLGARSAAPGARGYYPAFDVTPPRLVTRIVTSRGTFAPGRFHEGTLPWPA